MLRPEQHFQPKPSYPFVMKLMHDDGTSKTLHVKDSNEMFHTIHTFVHQSVTPSVNERIQADLMTCYFWQLKEQPYGPNKCFEALHNDEGKLIPKWMPKVLDNYCDAFYSYNSTMNQDAQAYIDSINDCGFLSIPFWYICEEMMKREYNYSVGYALVKWLHYTDTNLASLGGNTTSVQYQSALVKSISKYIGGEGEAGELKWEPLVRKIYAFFIENKQCYHEVPPIDMVDTRSKRSWMLPLFFAHLSIQHNMKACAYFLRQVLYVGYQCTTRQPGVMLQDLRSYATYVKTSLETNKKWWNLPSYTKLNNEQQLDDMFVMEHFVMYNEKLYESVVSRPWVHTNMMQLFQTLAYLRGLQAKKESGVYSDLLPMICDFLKPKNWYLKEDQNAITKMHVFHAVPEAKYALVLYQEKRRVWQHIRWDLQTNTFLRGPYIHKHLRVDSFTFSPDATRILMTYENQKGGHNTFEHLFNKHQAPAIEEMIPSADAYKLFTEDGKVCKQKWRSPRGSIITVDDKGIFENGVCIFDVR